MPYLTAMLRITTAWLLLCLLPNFQVMGEKGLFLGLKSTFYMFYYGGGLQYWLYSLSAVLLHTGLFVSKLKQKPAGKRIGYFALSMLVFLFVYIFFSYLLLVSFNPSIAYTIAYPGASDMVAVPPMIHPFASFPNIMHYVIQYGVVTAGILSAIATLIQTLLLAVYIGGQTLLHRIVNGHE